MVGGVAGGIDAGGAAEGVDLKAAVVGETAFAETVEKELRLQQRILGEGAAGFLGFAFHPGIPGAEHLERRPQNLAGLPQFSGIAGRKIDFHISISGLSSAFLSASS